MKNLKNKRIIWIVLVGIMLCMSVTSITADAKSKRRLSVKSKTLKVGQKCTIKLKGLSSKDKKKSRKVKWKVSNKSVVLIKKKSKYGITIRARKTGKVKVTGIYNGKKYKCTIRVKNKNSSTVSGDSNTNKEQADISMNASEVQMFYLGEDDKKYITPNKDHYYSYLFSVNGIKKGEDVSWSIESDSQISCFKVENGRVYMWKDPNYNQKVENATVVATLESGKKVIAKLYGYSEKVNIVDDEVNNFLASKIISDMTEYEKVEAIATYVSREYEYQLYQPDWMTMVIGGGGDCFSSRVFVKILCEKVGVKAVACVGEDVHGMTLVKADGKMYVVVTGFQDSQPRKYMIYEPNAESLQSIVDRSMIDLKYFE